MHTRPRHHATPKDGQTKIESGGNHIEQHAFGIMFAGIGEDLEEDVDLEEFADEIESWVIDEFKRIGLDTAKSVLALTKDELVRRADLEEETIDNVLNVLNQEFEL